MVALVLATTAVALFDLPVETIGSKFGGIPQQLPSLELPTFSWELVKQLVAPTMTIALLGAVESLLCARIADKLIDDRHDPKPGTDGAGHRQFRHAAFRRHSCNRHDCPHRHQRQERRSQPGRRHHSRGGRCWRLC